MNKIFTKIYSSEKLPFMQLRYSNSNKHYKKHFHSSFSLGINKEGISVYSNQNKKFILDKNRLSIMNPYEVHSCNSCGNTLNKYYMMYLDTSWCTKIQNIINNNIEDFVAVDKKLLESKEFYNRFLDLCEFIYENNSIEEKENELIEFFLDFFGLYLKEDEVKAKDENFETIKAFIHENYKENITLKDLSDKFDLNEYYIIRLFKKHLNITPHSYLLNLRVNHARVCLKEGMSIVETALECGFYDQSHLHRNFLNFVATTPKEYQLNFVQ
ncbi:AraC family transcriptional regulator [Arcobacter roscoffensis]|uniref:AraC family transcriptional regulator n=1 Tax=Arcobacter roscoffensis TaxID=2961520 RepID=A0ABY5E6H3_9BACT|nr:AraC family transcriptional regulator [Arcobacter roscoffensis]UTJ07771.1 AraC family transcriptional regulator [Arcobacter roscoffensis]